MAALNFWCGVKKMFERKSLFDNCKYKITNEKRNETILKI
jgi:hypothetical protein